MADRARHLLLTAPPRPPRDPSLFTSGVRFGVPGIYPQGSPMVPASGNPLDASGARAIVSDLVERRDPALVEAALERFDDSDVRDRIPDPVVRAAFALLVPTIGAPLVESFLDRSSPVDTIAIVEMPDSARTFGPVPNGAPGDRALNARYASEHPAAIAPSLVHHLGWFATGDRYEEALLHALLAMVDIQWLAVAPELALHDTELTRRQNSMALTLVNSRRPGSSRPAVRAPDGVGTLPGGDSALDTPDLWSIPFTRDAGSGVAVPDAVVDALRLAIAEPDAVAGPIHYDDDLAELLRIDLGDRWAPPADLLRAQYALGARTPDDLVAATRRPLADALDILDLRDVEDLWRRERPQSVG